MALIAGWNVHGVVIALELFEVVKLNLESSHLVDDGIEVEVFHVSKLIKK